MKKYLLFIIFALLANNLFAQYNIQGTFNANSTSTNSIKLSLSNIQVTGLDISCPQAGNPEPEAAKYGSLVYEIYRDNILIDKIFFTFAVGGGASVIQATNNSSGYTIATPSETIFSILPLPNYCFQTGCYPVVNSTLATISEYVYTNSELCNGTSYIADYKFVAKYKVGNYSPGFIIGGMFCKTSNEVEQTITKNKVTTNITNQNATICDGESVSFTAGNSNGSTFSFFKDAAATIPYANTGNTISFNSTDYNLGLNSFYVRPNGCVAVTQKVDFTVIEKPSNLVISGNTNNYCIGSPILISPSATATNPIFEWSSQSNFSSLLNNSFVDPQGRLSYVPTAVGNYTYYVRAKAQNGNCYSSPQTVNFTVNSNVSNVVVTPQNPSICFGQNAVFSASAQNATSYKWTSDNQGVNILSSSSTLNIGQANYSLGANTVYLFVSNNGNCNAPAVSVPFTVNAATTNLVVTGLQANYCTESPIFIQPSANGQNLVYQWSENLNFTTFLDSSFVDSNGNLSYIPTATATNNTFYVRSFNGNCYSNVVTVNYNINAGVTNLQVSNNGASFCEGQSISFTAGANNATVYNWYKFQNATGLLFTGPTYIPQAADYTLNSNSKIYVQAANANGCQSALTEINYTVNSIPKNLQTVGASSVYCIGNPISITPSAVIAGNTPLIYEWALTSNFANLLGSGFVDGTGRLSFTPTSSAPSTTYYVRAKSASGCYSATESVSFSISSNVSNVTVTPQNPSVCFGQNVSFSASAQNATSYKWTTDSQGVNIIGNNSTITLDQTKYTLGANTIYLTVGNAGSCNSTPTPVPFVVNDVPTNLIVTNNQATYCTGSPIFITPSATGQNLVYQWSSNSNFTSLIGNAFVDVNGNLSYTPTNTSSQNFFVRAYNGSCYSNVVSVNFVVNAGVTNLQVTNNGAVFCEGQPISFTAGASNATNYNFYQFPNATGLLFTGQTYTPQSSSYTVNAVNKVYLQASNNNNCQSALLEISYTVNAAPTAVQIIGNETSYCEGNPILITPSSAITGNTALIYEWSYTSNFVNILGSNFVDGLGRLNFSASGLGVQNFFVRAKSVNGCYSPATNVTFSVSPNVSNVTVTNQNANVCKGTDVVFSIGGTNATSYQWFSDALGTISIGSSQTYTVSTTNLPLGLNTIYAQAKGQNNCNSAIIPVNFTVNEAPSNLVLTGNSASYCVGSSIFVQPSANGTALQYQWSANSNFSSFLGSNFVDTNGNLSFSPTVTSNNTFYVRAYNGFCYSNTVSYNFAVVAGVSNLQVTNNGASFCQGQNISFTAGAVGATSYAYYRFSNATGLLNTGATYSPQPADYVVGTMQTIYVQAINGNGCQTALLPVTYTVYENPSNLQVSGNLGSYCINNQILITPSANGPSGLTYEWATTSNFVNILGSSYVDVNGNLNYSPAGSGNFNFFVRAKSPSGCFSAPVSVSFTVIPSVSNVTVTPQNPTVCFGQNVTFTASAQNATSYKWSSDNLGINVLGTNSTLMINPTNYIVGGNVVYLTVTNGASCNQNAMPISYTVNAAPSTLTISGNQPSYCTGNPIFITPTANGTGITYQWSNSATFNSLLGSSFVDPSGNLSYTPTVSGQQQNFYVRAYNGSCYSNVENVSFTITQGVGIIQVSNDGGVFCEGQPISFTAGASGASSFNYFKFPNGTGLLYTGATYQPTPTEYTLGLNTIYVQAVSSSGNCNTAIKPISFTVNESPTGIAVVGQTTYCKGQNITVTPSAIGQNLSYQWSTTSNFSPGNILDNTYVNAQGVLSYLGNTTGTVTYFVRAYNGSCYSSSIPVTITVNVQPTNLAVSKLTNPTSTEYCQNGSIEKYLATGVNVTQFKWYNDAALTQELPATYLSGTNNSTLNVNPLDWSIGVHNVYIVGLNSNSCLTAPVQINFTILSGITPVNPNINNFTICQGSSKTVHLDNPNNFTVLWYSNSAGTQALNSSYISNNGNTLNLSANDFNLGTNTLYYKVQNAGNCSSALMPISFSVLATPNTLAVTNNNATFCNSQSSLFEASAQNVDEYQWYQNFTSGLVVNPQYVSGTKNFRLTIPAGALANGTYTYQVVAVNTNGCTSAPINVNFTIQDVPGNITLTGAVSYCSTENVQYTLTSASTLTYQWFNDANALNAINAQYISQGGSVLNIPAATFAVGSHTIYYRGTNGNCNSPIQSVTFIVKSTPTNLNSNGNSGTYCVGDLVDIVVGSTGGATDYQWFEDAAASLQVNPALITGNLHERLQTTSISIGNHTYYVRAVNASGCYSALLPISFTVNAKPNVLQFASPTTTVVEQSPIVFNVNATGYTKWKLLFNGSQIAPTAGGWNNGTISSYTLTNSALLSNQGNYTFVISNGTCEDSKSFQLYVVPKIIITHNKLTEIGIDNGISKVILKQHDNITFTSNIGSNSTYSEVWDYGDGFNNSTVSGQHYYNNAGEFTVNLTVTNTLNGDVFTIPYEYPILVQPENNVIPTNTLNAPDSEYTIYPNPYKEFLGLKFEGQGVAGDKFVLRVYSITGLSVFDTDWIADGVNWDKKWYNPLLNKPSGTYIVVIYNVTKGSKFQAKLLKQ